MHAAEVGSDGISAFQPGYRSDFANAPVFQTVPTRGHISLNRFEVNQIGRRHQWIGRTRCFTAFTEIE